MLPAGGRFFFLHLPIGYLLLSVEYKYKHVITFYKQFVSCITSNMANTKDFFLTVTQRLFSNWTALRLAVEHGMGPKDRAIEFCPYITDMMYMNEKLDNDDVAMELEDYMDTNFRTELEDNSAMQVANELLRFYRYCMEGNETVATEEFSKLPPLQPWIMTRESIRDRNVRSLPNEDNSSSDSDIQDDKQMDTNNDDWVEVKTRRKT